MKIVIDGIGERIIEDVPAYGNLPNLMNMPQQDIHVKESSELGDALNYSNSDDVDPETGLSSINTKARLNELEMEGLVILDTFIALGVLPKQCNIYGRSFKQHTVSLNGEGRREMVNIIRGKIEGDQQPKGLKAMFSGLMPGGNKP